VDNSHAGWQVEFASNGDRRRCHANFLVDATGRSSSFSSQRGARRLTLDRLVGIVRFFVPHSTGFTSDGSTLIEAVEDGWWYTAALPDKRRVVIYMTDSDLYATAVRRNRDCWLQQLGKTTHCRSKVASYLPVSTHTRILAANSSRLDRVENKNWLALGDAAMAFDPLSGQGVYRALNSALQASRAIKGYWNGTDSALQDYAALIDKDFNNYLRLRKGFYMREQRWPHTPFWQRRQEEVFVQVPKGSE